LAASSIESATSSFASSSSMDSFVESVRLVAQYCSLLADRQEGLELFAQHIADVTRAINNSDNNANVNNRRKNQVVDGAADELGQQRRRACLAAGETNDEFARKINAH
jgi:hypothetical protein